jgi:Ty3 transposon capsid-like protein
MEQLVAQVQQLGVQLAAAQQEIVQLQQQNQALQQVNQPRRGAKPPKPSKFSGRNLKQSAQDFCFELRTYLLATGEDLNSQQAVECSASYLCGTALTWWRAYCNQVEHGQAPQFTTFAQFSEALIKRFTTLPPDYAARMRLSALRQTRSVRDYADKFNACMVELPNMDEADRIHNFIRGLKTAIQMDVTLKKPPTLTDAIELACQADSLMWANRKGKFQGFPRHAHRYPHHLLCPWS